MRALVIPFALAACSKPTPATKAPPDAAPRPTVTVHKIGPYEIAVKGRRLYIDSTARVRGALITVESTTTGVDHLTRALPACIDAPIGTSTIAIVTPSPVQVQLRGDDNTPGFDDLCDKARNNWQAEGDAPVRPDERIGDGVMTPHN